MLTSELTGDLPEIIGNEENLYEGNLILYFCILFYNSTNLENPYHNFRHTLPVVMSESMSVLSEEAATT
jgi:hypothetical protein